MCTCTINVMVFVINRTGCLLITTQQQYTQTCKHVVIIYSKHAGHFLLHYTHVTAWNLVCVHVHAHVIWPFINCLDFTYHMYSAW